MAERFMQRTLNPYRENDEVGLTPTARTFLTWHIASVLYTVESVVSRSRVQFLGPGREN